MNQHIMAITSNKTDKLMEIFFIKTTLYLKYGSLVQSMGGCKQADHALRRQSEPDVRRISSISTRQMANDIR